MRKYKVNVISIFLLISMVMSSIGVLQTSAIESGVMKTASLSGTFVRIEDGDSIRYTGSTGDVEISDDNKDDAPVIGSVSEYNNLKNKTKSSKADIAQTSALPSFVDNSASRFFPAIGDQGGLGSCQFWAQVYYQFTYTMNKEMGVTTTADNTFSPQWAYNIVASTEDRVGIYYDIYTMMKVQGNVFQSQVPYTQDTKSFSPTEDIWKTSIQYRLKSYQKLDDIGEEKTQITSPDDADLDVIKTALSNGDVLAYSSYAYSFDIVKLKENSSCPENKKYANQEVLKEVNGSEGAHRLTIVGYNDNIWTDVNNNNVVDAGEMGAFKVANSWGPNWSNSGFIWVCYDALNEVSCVKDVEHNNARRAAFLEVCRIDVRKHKEDSQLYLKYTLNTADRTQVKVSITAEKDGTPYTRQVYSNIYHGDQIAYDGSKEATDATMVGLLSNVVEGIKSEDIDDYSFSVTFEDMNKDSKVLTVKDVVIVDETAGIEYKVDNTYPFTLDGESKTVQYTESKLNHAVVYYRGYDNPKISYKSDGADFITDELIPTTERRGYVYKYVVDLGQSDSIQLYFTDENGDIDDNSGEYFTATKGINFYVTENVAPPIEGVILSDVDGVIDVDTGCDFNTQASGGYGPYQYRYTYTYLDTNEKKVEECSDRSNSTYYFRNEGSYEVAVEIKDFTDNVEVVKTIIEVKDTPFSFKEMYTDKTTYLVGDNVTINATTQNEKIKYTGRPKNKYDIEVKDELGDVWLKTTVFCKTYDLAKRFCSIIENFVPDYRGTYIATISSTDGNNEFAQMSVSFDVFDKTIGDANSDGAVSVMDATYIQRMLAGFIPSEEVNQELADCDVNTVVDVLDATYVQRYIASLADCASVGEIVEYIPPVKPTEPTEPETDPTEPTTPVTENKVTFTNSFRWSGNIYCYYWSDSDTAMTTWPGNTMTSIGVNEFGETMYTFTVPQGATYIIFTNGSSQTTDISYTGGEVRYYPIASTDSKGHNLVNTW